MSQKLSSISHCEYARQMKWNVYVIRKCLYFARTCWSGPLGGRDLLFFKDLFVLHLDFPDVTTFINYFVHWLGLNGVFRLNTWHQHLYDGSSQFVLDGSIANWLYYRDDEPHISYIYYISRKEADLGVLYLRNHFGDAVAVFVRFISHCKMKKKMSWESCGDHDIWINCENGTTTTYEVICQMNGCSSSSSSIALVVQTNEMAIRKVCCSSAFYDDYGQGHARNQF